VTISIPPALVSTAINNETIFIRCEASYEPELDLIYVWNKNGHRIDIENDFYYELVSIETILTKKISQFLFLGVEDFLVLYPPIQDKKKIMHIFPEKIYS